MNKITCKDCKEEFLMTDAEVEWFKQKGLTIPLRCKPCREAKKLRNAKREETNSRD